MDLTQLSPDEVVYWEWGFLELNATIVFTWGVMAAMILAAWLVGRRVTSSTSIPRSQNAAEGIIEAIGGGRVETDENVSKVSIVGSGMHSQPGVAARMFSSLAREGINIQMISTSEIKVSCLIEEKYTELAVRTLHAVFLEEEG